MQHAIKSTASDNKCILVCGAGGFIGTHLCEHLKTLGHSIVGVDLKLPLYDDHVCDLFYKEDLRDANLVDRVFEAGYLMKYINWLPIWAVQGTFLSELTMLTLCITLLLST
jgi:UDP-glucose 4-epimerase